MSFRLRRRALLGLGLAGLVTLFEESSFGLLRKTLFPSAQDIIEKYATIRLISPGDKGNIFLIGMEHYYAGTTRTGSDANAQQSASLAHVQSEIYGLLYHLAAQADAQLIVGEGIGVKELVLPYERKRLSKEEHEEYREEMNEHAHRVRFFNANPRETGYTALKIFNPELIRLFGADDRKEQQELQLLEREIFSAALRYVPKKSDWDNPEHVRRLKMVEERVMKRKNELKDARSRIYSNHAIELADMLHEDNVVIVIGSAHIHLMAQEYRGKRSLYILQPHSLLK
ncbi:MAG TPA: hypothetical protein VJH88_02900 [Candidatus Nanoarchaeia archaeon]|nr:hypothetical protein [Candidatus Nanoarchaeia archaeon]